jgi:hypothetical protein
MDQNIERMINEMIKIAPIYFVGACRRNENFLLIMNSDYKAEVYQRRMVYWGYETIKEMRNQDECWYDFYCRSIQTNKIK